MEETPALALVIDNGSSTIKAGFAGDDAPLIVFPSMVGSVKYTAVMLSAQEHQQYVGEEAQSKRGLLLLKYPIVRGVPTNWEDMEKIWHHTFHDQLHVDPREHPVLLTEPPLNPCSIRQRYARIMFETFAVPAMYVAIQAMLALYAHHIVTGVVVDSGDGVTYAVPFLEGFCIPHSIMRMDMAGRELTGYITRLLMEGGYFFTTTADLEAVREIKERLCYVAANFDEEMKAFRGYEQYMMPGGDIITVGNERFRCPELLFKPDQNWTQSITTIQDIICEAITRNDVDIRPQLWRSVVLSGSNTMFPGIQERLTQELIAVASSSAKVVVRAMPERKYAAWIGGSILSSLPTMEPMWATSTEYNQHGPTIITKKCL